jgi:Asp-tRNA(Asn)/Glu-tRNA(Gln) amidotransferase C subunit
LFSDAVHDFADTVLGGADKMFEQLNDIIDVFETLQTASILNEDITATLQETLDVAHDIRAQAEDVKETVFDINSQR